MAESIRIQIVYADEHRQIVRELRSEAPLTVEQALALAAADSIWQGVDLTAATVGVFARIVSRDRVLADGERLEIYAPLKIDPKSARRERARKR